MSLRSQLASCWLLAATGAVCSPEVSRAADPAAPVEAAALRAITTVAEASARWPNLEQNDVPVRLEGVVTGTMPSGAFRLHDGQLGIFAARSSAGQKLAPGDHVVVSGVLRPGGFSPWITPRQIDRLGTAPFPPARPASYNQLASGAADNQWLEIEGVVRAAEVLESRDFVVVDLGMAGGDLRVLVNYGPHPDLESLVDAKVRLRGVAAVNVSKQGHVVEPSFRVPSFAEITVTRPAPAGAFALPRKPIQQLLRLPPGESYFHRTMTSGVVTRRLSDRVFYLRDAGLGLKVKTRRPVEFRPGDVVEVSGFPKMEEGQAVLEQTTARLLRTEAPPGALRPTLEALLDGTHNSDLVTISARLVDATVTDRKATLILQTRDHLFRGLMDSPDSAGRSLPEKNSQVTVTGICVINELEELWFYRPRSFLLLVADATDLELVQAPSWWTRERLSWALATCGLVLLASAGWVWLLRRRIERKRAVIEQQTRHAAALEERSRIARELHDTLEQGLTGLSLQMKAMETDFAAAPHPAHTRLKFARQMLRQSRALARQAIGELRSEAVPARVEGLVEGLRRVAGSWNHSGALQVDLRIAGPVRPLPPHLESHLLGIGTEAMTNAVKHGRAESIEVELDFRPAAVCLRIKDNGTGFDVAQHLEEASGCFGLLGMRARARELCGEILIESRPGRGAEILVTVPAAVGPELALPP